MRQTYIVVDDFYKNPEQVRQFALAQEFKSPSYGTGYPGLETEPCDLKALMPIMQSVSKIVGKKIGWDPESVQGMFRLMDKHLMDTRNNLIHTDPCRWTGIIYLSLAEHCKGGLSLFRHKETGLTRLHPQNDEKVLWAMNKYNMNYEQLTHWFYKQSLDLDKWIETDFISCQFNRLLLFDGGIFHGIIQLFGDSKENSRLSQHFFVHEVESVSSGGQAVLSS
ncbi:MAG: DUF6445 family protein [Candidatus Caenarcaniphilales bacterium]|nr:DUF6445 family protein [Candidatus Caenarcaniphilales bacterium]